VNTLKSPSIYLGRSNLQSVYEIRLRAKRVCMQFTALVAWHGNAL